MPLEKYELHAIAQAHATWMFFLGSHRGVITNPSLPNTFTGLVFERYVFGVQTQGVWKPRERRDKVIAISPHRPGNRSAYRKSMKLARSIYDV